MAGTWSKVYTAIPGDDITASRWNAEFDNVITYADFAGLGDYSATISQMRLTTDPYPAGVESLATDGTGELERMRYVLTQHSGKTYWYQDPSTNLETIYGAIGASATQVLRPNGTASAPSSSYAGDPNNGEYLSGTDQLSWAVGGTQKLILDQSYFQSVGPILGPDGSVANPGFAFSGDPNNGAYRLASDQWGLVSNGVLRILIDQSAPFVHIGEDSDTTNVVLRLNGASSTGVATGTLTNCPTAGNPTGYIHVNIKGTTGKIPYWS